MKLCLDLNVHSIPIVLTIDHASIVAVKTRAPSPILAVQMPYVRLTNITQPASVEKVGVEIHKYNVIKVMIISIARLYLLSL